MQRPSKVIQKPFWRFCGKRGQASSKVDKNGVPWRRRRGGRRISASRGGRNAGPHEERAGVNEMRYRDTLSIVKNASP